MIGARFLTNRAKMLSSREIKALDKLIGLDAGTLRLVVWPVWHC